MRNPKRVWIPSLILIGLLALVFLFLRYRGITHISREQIDQIQVYIRQTGFWGPLIYLISTVVLTVLLFPATPLILVAGVFGVVMGSIYAVLALSVGASISFLLARHTLRPYVARWLAKRPAFRKLDEGVRREGVHVVFVTRLVPAVPFCIQNYAYGLTKVGFWPYSLITALCLTPSVIAYVFIGSSLISGEGEIKRILLYIMAGCVLLALLSLLPRLLLRGRKRPLPVKPETGNRKPE